MNALSTFERMMDDLLGGLQFVKVCLNDVVVFSESTTEHVEHLKEIIILVAILGLKVMISKFEFAEDQVQLLQHIFDGGEVRVDPQK